MLWPKLVLQPSILEITLMSDNYTDPDLFPVSMLEKECALFREAETNGVVGRDGAWVCSTSRLKAQTNSSEHFRHINQLS